MQGVSAQDDIFLLNKFSKYGKEKERIVINYDHDSRLVEKLKSTYNDFPQNEASEFRTLVNIRKWVNKYLYFQNVSFLEEFRESNWNTLFVLELMKKKPFLCDCGTYSMVLTEILLSMGYKAKWIQCLPLDLRYVECHTVVQVFVNELNKWIVLDPAFNCCYYNSKGIAMDLSEMRKSLIKSEKIQIPFCPVERKKMILDYWTKNIFRFRCLDNYCFGFIGRAKKNYLYLHPNGYTIIDKAYNNEKHIYFYNEDIYWNS